MMSVEETLGPGGRLAKTFPHYENRPEQVQMARAVAETISGDGKERRLLVEAGTGVGKSFAYLVPVIEHAATTGEKFVISTHTIALQEQLLGKDIPTLRAVMPDEFTAVLAKGRNNYICLRRLQIASERSHSLFDHERQFTELQRVQKWAAQTRDGTLSDFQEEPPADVWSQINAEQGNCMGKKCRFYSQCHWQMARRRMFNANLLIVNHHLLLSDVALRVGGAKLLPDYDHLIVDEAHSLENAAGEHLGIRVTSRHVDYVLNTLYNPRRGTGRLMPHLFQGNLEKTMAQARRASEVFFDDVFKWYNTSAPANKRARKADFVENPLSPALMGVYHEIAEIVKTLDNEEDSLELRSQMQKCLALADSTRIFIEQKADGFVYWVEMGGRNNTALELHAAPVDVSDTLRHHLLERVKSAVFTSATLTLGARKSFQFIADRLGLREARTLSVGSPFDYEKQAEIHIPAAMPEPTRDDDPAYQQKLTEQISRHLVDSSGGAFVLFTSNALMRRCYESMKPFFKKHGLHSMLQGDGLPRSRMLDLFKTRERSVLFGSESFWQGVDVPGDALQTVILTRLPFPVPSHPLVEARCEWIESAGGNAFADYSLPTAVLKLKQGFGRLIRSKTDTGRVVILDSRILRKSYGSVFLDSLPQCPITTGAEDTDGDPH